MCPMSARIFVSGPFRNRPNHGRHNSRQRSAAFLVTSNGVKHRMTDHTFISKVSRLEVVSTAPLAWPEFSDSGVVSAAGGVPDEAGVASGPFLAGAARLMRRLAGQPHIPALSMSWSIRPIVTVMSRRCGCIKCRKATICGCRIGWRRDACVAPTSHGLPRPPKLGD